jgi:hypothetical protein
VLLEFGPELSTTSTAELPPDVCVDTYPPPTTLFDDGQFALRVWTLVLEIGVGVPLGGAPADGIFS